MEKFADVLLGVNGVKEDVYKWPVGRDECTNAQRVADAGARSAAEGREVRLDE